MKTVHTELVYVPFQNYRRLYTKVLGFSWSCFLFLFQMYDYSTLIRATCAIPRIIFMSSR